MLIGLLVTAASRLDAEAMISSGRFTLASPFLPFLHIDCPPEPINVNFLGL